jgi:hypothetical protein
MSDIYLSLTETPGVVTLSQPVVASVMVNTVTVANVVSVNVVTMPAINVTAAGGLTNAELRASAVSVAVTTMPALSISSVSISNFPSSQLISGTVTANVEGIYESGTLVEKYLNVRPIYFNYSLNQDELVSDQKPLPISGTVTANVPRETDTNGLGSCIPIGGFSTQSTEYRTLELTEDNKIIVGSLPAISGTVTANVGGIASGVTIPVRLFAEQLGGNPSGQDTLVVCDSGGKLLINAVAGPDASVLGYDGNAFVQVKQVAGSSVTIGSLPVQLSTTTIGGTARLNVTLSSATTLGATVPSYGNLYGGSDGTNFRAINVDSSGRTVITGSVGVAQLPRVTFIDGSGSVTTANSAITVFASSTTRSYLLVQVTTGSAFVNVGATATTVNGISLTAGQGYAWETTIPQGLVSLISTTTSSRWVAKEA